jgi:hypothetical protein
MAVDEHSAEVDHDALVGRLRESGIHFLTPSDADAGDLRGIPLRELVKRLVTQSDARLRSSLVPLLILHPEWAADVQVAVGDLEEPEHSELKALYCGAVYLQRLWRTRLGFYLGQFELLPDLFSSGLGLPPADERHGKTGLYALAAWHESRSPYPFNRLATYNKMLELLFEQLKIEARRHESKTAG